MAQPNILSQDTPRPPAVLRVEREALPMSQRLWNLDWRSVLPWHFDDGRAEFASAEEALPFIRDHYAAIFGQKDLEGRFLPSPTTEAKRRFFAEMDYFILRVGERDAGIVLGHPSDWTTYYVRSAALLPAYRDRHLLTQFSERLYEPLRASGVERIEAECSPANVPMARLLTGQGYMVTGSVTSERWGVVLRYTKFLSEDAIAAFMRQYTAMPFGTRHENITLNTDRRTP
jgi:hypothetical protein